MAHEHIGLVVMYKGQLCRIDGVTYSAANAHGGIAYHLMPEGKHSLSDLIQYVTANQLTFDDKPPEYVAFAQNGSARIIEFPPKDAA